NEASALGSSLMGDLSKANSIVLPPESVLSKDVEAMTEAIPTNKRAKAAEIFNDTKVQAEVPCITLLRILAS
nr:serine/threonine-protein kinase SMG1-like [Tanacetum cinerariifolium]